MNGFAQIKTLLADKLRGAGVTTVEAWSRKLLPRLSGAAAVLGFAETESGDAALWNYLGEAWDETLGCPVERYGRRVKVTLFADLYAPMDGAALLDAACGALETLALTPLVKGLRLEAVRRGEVYADSVSGYLKCRCTAVCTAYFTASRTEEGAELTDFTLKGVLQ